MNQSEGFPRTGYLFPARDGLWPGLKKEVLLSRRRRRRRRHLGIVSLLSLYFEKVGFKHTDFDS